MKNVLKLIKNNLTHKILPIISLSIFLLFFFLIFNVDASNTLTPEPEFVEEDSQLMELVKNTSQYKSGDYYLFIGRNDKTYYKILFVRKRDDFKCYVDNFSGGSYSLIYNARSERVCYFASKNPTSLSYQYNSYDGGDLLYNSSSKIFYSTCDVYNSNQYTDLFMTSRAEWEKPYIANEDYILISNDSHDVIVRSNGLGSNLSLPDIIFTISRVKNNGSTDGEFNTIELLYTVHLNPLSSYYIADSYDKSPYSYYIPSTDIGITFQNNFTYSFKLEWEKDGVTEEVVREILCNTPSEFDGINSSLESQTEAIKENTQTNKGIFESLKEVLSYINPLSENFFVYKLIELLLEGFKSLFIPSDNFFNNWLSDLNNYFGDRFGIIYYPFELIIDFFTRIVNTITNVDISTAVINVPELKVFDKTLIESFSFDFNTMLENETLNTVHQIYLMIMDVIFSLMLIHLARKTFGEIFGGSFSDEVIGDITADERSYNKYVKYQENKSKYGKTKGE